MTVSVVLASGSPSRRRVLLQAGVNPNISVSHVDEPAALEEAAARHNAEVSDLSAKQRVEILAKAKARTVAQSYRSVARVAAGAQGEQITAYPLRAVGGAQVDDGEKADTDEPVDHTLTRDFSDVDMPTETMPLSKAVAGLRGFESADRGPLIVGCDSMFLFDGKALGKPHTPEVARKRLQAMRGKSGELWTGHCVIDLATGHEVSATSHAKVTFADYTDEQIEAYVATGEPLEVAGCFTLEGLGGAFIESVDGDPSGVLGISLPLLRRMVAELGIDWTELWNWDGVSGIGSNTGVDNAAGVNSIADAGNDSSSGDASNISGSNDDNVAVSAYSAKQGQDFGLKPPEAPASFEARVAAVTSPQGRIRQPGDGWVECACGRKHWGRCGAAGVLLARRDAASGKVSDIVMQHRAVWSAEGGTWGVPGGAIGAAETPIEGALREAYEEANITPDDVEVVGTHREEHGPWAYTTVIAFEKPGCSVDPHPNDDESLKIGWVPVGNVAGLKLLTAFRTDWPGFMRRLDELASEYVER